MCGIWKGLKGRQVMAGVVGKKETILEEAQRIIHGVRDDDYGHPRDDFTRTAAMWSVLFGVTVDARDVALAMILLKVSREMNKPKRDNLVDIAGYAGTIERLSE